MMTDLRADEYSRFYSTTTRTYLIALSLVATLSVLAYLTMHRVMDAHGSRAGVINVSGRQRMLSQRIALYSEYLVSSNSENHASVETQLEALLDRFEKAHVGLSQGNKELGEPIAPVRDMYFGANHLDDEVQTFIRSVRNLLSTAGQDHEKQNAALVKIRELQELILPKLDQTVKLNQEASDVQVGKLKDFESFILGFTLLLLLVEAFFIFRPMVNSISKLLVAAAEARETALRATDAKSAFLATITHEIRTPMTGVLGISDALLETDLPEENRNQVATIKRLSETLVSMVNDILDYSKIEAGKLTLEVVDFNLPSVAIDTHLLFSSSALKKNIQFSFDVDSVLPVQLQGDPTRLRQVVTNFVGNAVKFTPVGGTIRLTVKPGAAGFVRFEVSDSGPGIALDARERIFGRFNQADETVSRNHGGTGLGLSICKQIAELMNGRIGVVSEVGKGSTFWFEVPLEKASNVTEVITGSARPSNPNANIGLGYQLLLAEDNEVNQKILVGQLTRMGFRVQVASNGREAVRAFDAQSFDLVLMDCEMPEMDGFAATREIRKLEVAQGRSPLPILALTGHSGQEIIDKCIGAGMTLVLTKPIRVEKLAAQLREWLPQRTANKESTPVPRSSAS